MSSTSLENLFESALLSVNKFSGVVGTTLVYVYQLPGCYHLVISDVKQCDLVRLFGNSEIMSKLITLNRTTVIIIYGKKKEIVLPKASLPKGFYIFEKKFGLTTCVSFRYGITDLKIRFNVYDDTTSEIRMIFVDLRAMSTDTVFEISKESLKAKNDVVVNNDSFLHYHSEVDGNLTPIVNVKTTTLADIYHNNLVLVISIFRL